MNLAFSSARMLERHWYIYMAGSTTAYTARFAVTQFPS